MRTVEVHNQSELDAVPDDPETRITIKCPWSESIVVRRAEKGAVICAYRCIVTVLSGCAEVFDGGAIVRGRGAAAILHGSSRGSCADGGSVQADGDSMVDVLRGGTARIEGNAKCRVFDGGRAYASGCSQINVQMGGYAELTQGATGTILCRGTAIGYGSARMIVATGSFVKRGERGGRAEKGVIFERLQLEGAPKRSAGKKEKPSQTDEKPPDGQEVFVCE